MRKLCEFTFFSILIQGHTEFLLKKRMRCKCQTRDESKDDTLFVHPLKKVHDKILI